MTVHLRQIKNRIKAVENTKKVTSALELISVAKYNRMDKIFNTLKPYSAKVDSILNNLLSACDHHDNGFFESRSEKNKIGVCLITSDSGLCGSYNNNIIRLAEGFIRETGIEKIKLIAVGKKGLNYFKKCGVEIINSYPGLSGRFSEAVSKEITHILIDIFMNREVDEVHIAYNHFQTLLIHNPIIVKFLNLEKTKGGKEIEYISEPDIHTVLQGLLLRYISVKLSTILLEAFTAEHAARTVAMRMATDNAKDLLTNLTLLRNKVRQAGITQDMMEIIAASEALRS